jgi:hypothetical protein
MQDTPSENTQNKEINPAQKIIQPKKLTSQAKLRQYYKQLKVGFITWNEIPSEYQYLIRRYYRLGLLIKKY